VRPPTPFDALHSF